jgi:hypothetical protein
MIRTVANSSTPRRHRGGHADRFDDREPAVRRDHRRQHPESSRRNSGYPTITNASECADVMGYSHGGRVALQLTLCHPTPVDKLVSPSTRSERGRMTG